MYNIETFLCHQVEAGLMIVRSYFSYFEQGQLSKGMAALTQARTPRYKIRTIYGRTQ